MININYQKTSQYDLLQIDLGSEPMTGDEIVQALKSDIDHISIKGGILIKISGRCTVAGAYVLAKKLTPLYQVIAIQDPKLDGFIVVVSQGARDYSVGDVINPE